MKRRTRLHRVAIIRAGPVRLKQVVLLFDAYRRFYKQGSDIAGAQTFLRKRLARDESVVFLAMDGKEAVGFGQLYPTFDSVTMQSVWILYDLYVAPTARKRGVAKLLMARALRFAKGTKAKGLILETAVGNVVAQKLYEQLGWKRDKAFHRYYLDV